VAKKGSFYGFTYIAHSGTYGLCLFELSRNSWIVYDWFGHLKTIYLHIGIYVWPYSLLDLDWFY